MRVSVVWLASVVCASLFAGGSHAAVLYSQSTANTGIAGLGAPVAVTDPTINGLSNCLASNGCMGFGSAVQVQDFTLTFSVTAAQLANIMASAGSATFTITAARDIGIRNGGTAPGTEFLIVTGEGATPLGNLYQNLISTDSVSDPGRCTTSVHNETPPVALDCGPNFDNDFAATQSLTISQADFEAFAADGTVSILIHPTLAGTDCLPAGSTCGVGRLTLFSATLDFSTAVPEPSSMALISFGLLGVAVARRTRRAATR